MYCLSCGKEIPDHSKFCSYCGASTAASSEGLQEPVEWEYESFVVKSEPRGRYEVGQGETEYHAGLFFWSGHQRELLLRLQEWLDAGWEPITEVGPSAFVFTRRVRHTLFSFTGIVYLELEEFRVRLRRPKRKR